MKNLYIFLLGLTSCIAVAQDRPDPYTAVSTFFEGFHERDSLKLLGVVTPDTQLYRTGNTREGVPFREAGLIQDFIRSVVSRPASPVWEERLGEPVVHQDQNLAVVWVPFRFYLDQKLRHCGYNLFTLFWNGNQWVITQLSDTGTRTCKE